MLTRRGAKQAEIAAYFGISVRSLQRLTKKHSSARARGRCHRQLDVLVALWQRYKTSDRILLLLAKRYLGGTTT